MQTGAIPAHCLPSKPATVLAQLTQWAPDTSVLTCQEAEATVLFSV